MSVKGAESGNCKVCTHPARLKIEMTLARGAGHRAVGREFGISHHSIGRHLRSHITEARRSMLSIGPFEQEALLAAAAEESRTVLDFHRLTRAALLRFLSNAVDAGDGSIGAMIAGRLTEVNTAIGKLTGEVLGNPSVSNNLNIFLAPMYSDLETAIVTALAKHPAARADVARALRDLEERAVNAATENQPRLIEHAA